MFVDVPASLTSNGKCKRKLFDSQKRALEVARELYKSIDPVTGMLRVRQRPSGIAIEEAVEKWLANEQLRVKTLKKRENTLYIDRCRLKSAKVFFKGEALSAITEQRLIEFQAHRLSLGRNPRTINSEITTLGLVLRCAVKDGYLESAPKFVRVPVHPLAVVIPTPEEVVRIIGALPERLRPLIRSLAEIGCRKGEAVNPTWDCIDENGGNAEIISRDGWTLKTQQSERRAPLNDDLLEMIRMLPKIGPYVFPGKRPDAPVGSFTRAWTSAVKTAQIRRRGQIVHLPVKTLRKAHATLQAERGISESVLQGLLGHSRGSHVTRQLYVHVSDEAKRAAVITLPINSSRAL